jgi:hypothetical protein
MCLSFLMCISWCMDYLCRLIGGRQIPFSGCDSLWCQVVKRAPLSGVKYRDQSSSTTAFSAFLQKCQQKYKQCSESEDVVIPTRRSRPIAPLRPHRPTRPPTRDSAPNQMKMIIQTLIKRIYPLLLNQKSPNLLWLLVDPRGPRSLYPTLPLVSIFPSQFCF